MKSYPVNLIGLENRRCVVVGGGAVAARKAAGLVAAGARPVVVSPSLHRELAALHRAGHIEHLERQFQEEDLRDAFLVIAASDDTVLNRRIWKLAQARGILVNVVDAPAMCNFFAPAVVRRGDFTVSIATGGAAPALAAQVRKELAAQFGDEYQTLTAWCAAMRPMMQELFPEATARTARWHALVASPVLDLLAAGQQAKAREWIAKNLRAELAARLPPEDTRT